MHTPARVSQVHAVYAISLPAGALELRTLNFGALWPLRPEARPKLERAGGEGDAASRRGGERDGESGGEGSVDDAGREARGGDDGEERAAAGRRSRRTRGGGDRGRLMSARIHTFSLSPPTHRTRGWFLSTHSRVACSSVGRNNIIFVMLCSVPISARRKLPVRKPSRTSRYTCSRRSSPAVLPSWSRRPRRLRLRRKCLRRRAQPHWMPPACKRFQGL